MLEALLARTLTHPHVVPTFCHGVSEKKARGGGGGRLGWGRRTGAQGLVHEVCLERALAAGGLPTRCPLCCTVPLPPALPQVDATGKVHEQVWIVQEFCNRGDLLEAIDRGFLHHGGGAGGPNLAAIAMTALEVAGALAYLHSHNVIHGDLTPRYAPQTPRTHLVRASAGQAGCPLAPARRQFVLRPAIPPVPAATSCSPAQPRMPGAGSARCGAVLGCCAHQHADLCWHWMQSHATGDAPAAPCRPTSQPACRPLRRWATLGWRCTLVDARSCAVTTSAQVRWVAAHASACGCWVGGRACQIAVAQLPLAWLPSCLPLSLPPSRPAVTHMPPETLAEGTISKATDVYSFGAPGGGMHYICPGMHYICPAPP